MIVCCFEKKKEKLHLHFREKFLTKIYVVHNRIFITVTNCEYDFVFEKMSFLLNRFVFNDRKIKIESKNYEGRITSTCIEMYGAELTKKTGNIVYIYYLLMDFTSIFSEKKNQNTKNLNEDLDFEIKYNFCDTYH